MADALGMIETKGFVGMVEAADAAVKAARERNRRFPKRRPIGASTITQQLAKNLYLSPARSWIRKGREAAIALTMELLLPKRTILETYLSGIEWGERVWGCEAAARKYFGTSAASLTRAQPAWLAAMILSTLSLNCATTAGLLET